MQKSFLKKLFLAFWLILVLQGLPVFFFQKTTLGAGDSVKCLSIHQPELSSPYVNYGLVLLTCSFLLPFVVSLAAHLRLGAYLSKISNANIRKKLTKTKSIQIITVALVIFAVCFAPFHACQALAALVQRGGLSCERRRHLEVAYFVSLVFSIANCCLDPFIYNFANDKFHQFVLRFLRRQKSFLKKLALVVWVVLLLQGLPIFFFLKTTVIDGSTKCLSIHQAELSSLYLSYSIVLGLLGFLLPFGVSCVSYVMLGSYIAKISQANLRGRLVKSKSIQMIVIALVIFGVCFVPLHVCGLVAALARYHDMSCPVLHTVQVAYFVSVVFTMVNCCLDPFIYNFANEKFNRAFLHALKRLLFSK
ncbi:hypothetical protein lerEdw1_006740 [Lerista edwardsae]|nr:hypothetical protein lerEdw1_006740 [Lerista edwardsae]